MTSRLIFGIYLLFGMVQIAQALQKSNEKLPFDYVNPFIGTGGDGHTYPGATVPFGMVQPSPDTGIKDLTVDRGEAYHWCAGYRYEDTSIAGFSHAHFSGTGHSDLGDVLVIPTEGPVNFNRGSNENPDEGYRSRYSHQNESASPGYYQVFLDDYNINVELTASNRVAFHRYTFPESNDSHIFLDLTSSMHDYPGKVIWSQIRVENETTLTGFRQTRGWGATRYVYFAIEFSKPIKSYTLVDEDQEVKYNGFGFRGQKVQDYPEKFGKLLKAHFDFETVADEEVLMKVAISGVSTAGAIKNLKTEIPHWDFEKVRAQAKSAWEKELNQITIEGTDRDKEIFYTSVYHTMLAPVTYMDADNQYRGIDQNIHKAEGFTNYTIFSLWDTYRALHPLFTITQPERTVDMIQSMLMHQKQSVHHALPVWSFHANETWCMIGYHAVPVIADAFAKGIRGFDADQALNAMTASAKNPQYGGLDYYMEKGYIPFDKHRGSSVSKTLEYAYDDWTIAQMASQMKNDKVSEEFRNRAAYYKNIFDTSVGFTRGKKEDGTWREDFNPISPSTLGGGDFTEGNSWQYSWYVPHDMNGVMNLLGGEENFTAKLDSVFEVQLDKSKFDHVEDMVGLIGQYAHGNEPSHHIAYLYNYGGKPWKTQERIHQIMDNLVDNTPDGLAGNDDCGQMSAWYVFSSLGFYPVCPGSNEYVFGSPSVQSAKIELSNGNTFEISSKNLSKKNIYIQGITLNGKPYEKTYLRHENLINGGKLVFQMGSKPNKDWATALDSRPFSMSELKK